MLPSPGHVPPLRERVQRHGRRPRQSLPGGREGGWRFRAGRFTPREERGSYSGGAMRLRHAMRFDGDRAALYLERGWWSPADTLSQWLVQAASKTPDAPAIVGDGQSLSYGALAQRVAALAGGLKALGLGSGDVVAVQLPNRGGVPRELPGGLRDRRGHDDSVHAVPRRRTGTAAGPFRARAFIGLDEIGDFKAARTVLDLRRRIATLEHVLVLGEAPDGARPFATLTGAAAHDLSDGPVAAAPFLLLYTSGTSSQPKGVPLAYHGILGNARLAVAEHGITAADRILSAAPFGHLYGLYAFHLALAAGACTVLLPTFTPPDLTRVLGAESVTVLFAGPAHVAACLGAGLLDAGEVASLRLAVMAGSPLPPAVAKGLQERIGKGHVTQLWGMTELQAGLYTRPGDPIEIVAASAGRPSPGTEVRVVGADGTELPAGAEGELQVRGPLLFPDTSTTRRPTAMRSSPRAGSAPATLPSSPPTETSPSGVAARTSSTAAASSTTPRTSKTCSPLTR